MWKNSKKLTKLVKIDKNCYIFWTTWWISMNFSGENVTYGNPTCQKKSGLNPVSRRYIFGTTIASLGLRFISRNMVKFLAKLYRPPTFFHSSTSRKQKIANFNTWLLRVRNRNLLVTNIIWGISKRLQGLWLGILLEKVCLTS